MLAVAIQTLSWAHSRFCISISEKASRCDQVGFSESSTSPVTNTPLSIKLPTVVDNDEFHCDWTLADFTGYGHIVLGRLSQWHTAQVVG